MTIFKQLARGTYLGFLPLIAAAVGVVGGIIQSKKQKKAQKAADKSVAEQQKKEAAIVALETDAKNKQTDLLKKVALYGGIGLAGIGVVYFMARRK